MMLRTRLTSLATFEIRKYRRMPSRANDPINGRLIPGEGDTIVDISIEIRNTNISPSVGVTTTALRSTTMERTIGTSSSNAPADAIDVGTPWNRDATTSTFA